MSLAPGRIVTCGGCGKTEPWGPEWRWPNVPMDAGYYDARVGRPACRAACEAKILAGALA